MTTKELHKNLNILIARYTMDNEDKELTEISVMELRDWSGEQTLNPTESNQSEGRNE